MLSNDHVYRYAILDTASATGRAENKTAVGTNTSLTWFAHLPCRCDK